MGVWIWCGMRLLFGGRVLGLEFLLLLPYRFQSSPAFAYLCAAITCRSFNHGAPHFLKNLKIFRKRPCILKFLCGNVFMFR